MNVLIIRRFFHGLVVIFGVSVVVFLLIRLAPGDPALMMLPEEPTAAEITQMRKALGLDRPLLIQYGLFISRLLRADLGRSISYRQPNFDLIIRAVPKTFELAMGAMIVAVLISLPVGVLAAKRPNGMFDTVILSFVLMGQSVPTFWLGIMLIFLFAVKLHIFPTSGSGTIVHLILPAVTLSTFMIALLVRLVRSGLIEVLGEDYVRTARAKGLCEFLVVNHHALRNALIPVVTIVGLQIARLMGGALITETVFSWPGLGLLAISAINARDYPLVQACILTTALVFVLMNFLVDILYTHLDPRIRY